MRKKKHSVSDSRCGKMTTPQKKQTVKTVFKEFGHHRLKGVMGSDGRFVPDYRDATRILFSLLGVPSVVLDTMPTADSPSDAAETFRSILTEMEDRPGVTVFRDWLDFLMQGDMEYIGRMTDSVIISMVRTFGRVLTEDESFQLLLIDPDTTVVTDGDITQICDDDGNLLAETRKR